MEHNHSHDRIVRRVREIYEWIETELLRARSEAGDCRACGQCCDFERFEHRLFVTTPELLYFREAMGDASIRAMLNGVCPYRIDEQCSVYDHRFAGCRIFHCDTMPVETQGFLSEQVVREFKQLCEDQDMPYRYVDLRTGLNQFHELLPDLKNPVV